MTWPVVITVGGYAGDPIRKGFALAVLGSWVKHQQADVRVINGGFGDEFLDLAAHADLEMPPRIGTLFPENRQRDRHIMAVKYAASVGARWVWDCDDDCLPRPEMDLDVAAALLDAHPEVWLAAVHLPSCPMPHGADGAHTGPLVETGAVGGLRVLRVDAFRNFAWPALDPRMGGRYDATWCQAIRAAGGKVAFFGDGAPRHLRAQHLGEFVSTFEWPYPRARTYPRKWDE